jgi:toluene monooxygenase system protein D
MKDPVGPVLRMCEEIDLVVQAILDDNSGHEVEVIDSGSYVRVQAPRFMRVTLASLRRHVGGSFEMCRFEAMLSAFAGQIATTSEEITWSLGGDA